MPLPLRLVASLVLGLSACSPAARLPPAGTSGPPDPSTPVVTLERTPCYGRCPVYTVAVYTDGRVVFDGRQHVAREGRSEGRVGPEAVARLVASAEAAGHAGFPASLTRPSGACPTFRTDQPGAVTTVRTAGGTSRVEHDLGCSGFAGEAALTAFEGEVDRVLGTAAWVGSR